MTPMTTLILFVFVSHHSAPHVHIFSLMGYMTNKITQIGTSGKGMVIHGMVSISIPPLVYITMAVNY